MAPLVSHDKRPLEGKEIACDERLEKVRIGHPGDPRATKIGVKERRLRSSDDTGGDQPELVLYLTGGSCERSVDRAGRWPALTMSGTIEGIELVRRGDRKHASAFR